MKEKIKKILLWFLFIFFILGFINTVISIFTFPAERAALEAEGVELVFPELTITLNFVWLILFGGIIVIIYKKLFPKKEVKKETPSLEALEKEVFAGSLLSKILFISHFFVLIFAISQFIVGSWKLGIFGIVIATLMAYTAYRLTKRKQNLII